MLLTFFCPAHNGSSVINTYKKIKGAEFSFKVDVAFHTVPFSSFVMDINSTKYNFSV